MKFIERIIGRENYISSAVLVLIVEISNQKYILFEKRAATIRQGGDICFPGGKIDKNDKNSLETALRETYEEIGIKKEKIKIINKIGTLITPSKIIVEAYLGAVNLNSLDDLKINRDEVEFCFIVPLTFFKKTVPTIYRLEVETKPYYKENGVKYFFPVKELNLPKLYHTPWKSIREVYLYNYENMTIWGITAEIIVELVKYNFYFEKK